MLFHADDKNAAAKLESFYREYANASVPPVGCEASDVHSKSR